MSSSVAIKKRTLILLSFIFILGLIYRFFFFPENIYFGYDQARDAYISQRIIQERDIILWGPPTSIEGVYHGPLYYYLIGPLYLFGNGDPRLPVAFSILVNAVGVFLIFLIAKILFNSKVGLLSALIYAFSFEQYQYAYYLTDPAPAMISILILFLGLAKVIFRNEKLGWLLIAIGLSTAIHFEFFLIYLSAIILVYILVFRNVLNTNKKWLLIGFITSIALLSNYIIAEFKYGFRSTNSLISSLGTSSNKVELVPTIKLMLSKYFLQSNLNVFGLSLRIAAIIFVLLLVFLLVNLNKKKEFLFLLIWILAPSLLYVFFTYNLFSTNLGISPAIIIVVSYLLLKYIKSSKLRLAVISIILLGNVNLLINEGRGGLVRGLMAVQEGMLLWDEREVIDYTYRASSEQPFEIKTLTMPLKIQTTWSYLYEQYGNKKYGYMPYSFWDNVPGYPGSFAKASSVVCNRYLIVEPTRGIGQWFIDEFYFGEEESTSLIEEKTFGAIKVQKRFVTDCETS